MIAVGCVMDGFGSSRFGRFVFGCRGLRAGLSRPVDYRAADHGFRSEPVTHKHLSIHPSGYAPPSQHGDLDAELISRDYGTAKPRALNAGEMPPVRPFVFTTDYSPTDWATMLQSGGVQLLDVQTLMAVRNDESVIRWGLSRMAWYQKLSDELIVPNLDQDISFFYDTGTKKLRKRFEIYPEALDARVRFANELERTHMELLKRIQAERQRIH